MNRPRLKAHLVPVLTDDDKIFILSEDRSYLLSGAAERAVLPLLDGSRSLTDVAMALAGSYPLPAIILAVQKFARTGLLVDGPATLPRQQTAYWDAMGLDHRVAVERLAQRPVAVRTVGTADGAGVLHALVESGIQLADPTDDTAPYLTLVVTDDYLNPELAEINRSMHATGRRWMLSRPGGVAAWVGPVFAPGESACWECLRQRMDSNRMVEQYLHQFGGIDEPAVLGVAGLPSTALVADGLTAMAVVTKVATGTAAAVESQLLSIDTSTLEMARHHVVRRPQCGVCGDPKVMQFDAEPVLEREPVAFSADGGFRSMPPEATYDRLRKHVSAISGAVSWLEPLITDNSGLSYSYSAGHNFAMIRNDITVLRKNLRGNSGGKGRSEIQAKVSGICEAIERFSGVWSEDRPTVRSRADQLGERHVLPNELMLFGPEQFQQRVTINADPINLLHRVPHAFDTSLSIDWTAAWSLTNGEVVQVPSSYVWFGHPDCPKYFFTYSDGNGNAAGNTLEEAILQGFLELVERDAVGIWWYNRIRRAGVDLASFHDPYIDSLLEYYRSMGRSLWLLDITSDLGIPTFVAVSKRDDNPREDILLAFGSHLDPRLAALRALTETNQFLPAVHNRDADGNTVYLEEDAATLEWWHNATVADNDYLLPDPAQPQVSIADYPVPRLDTVADYVQLCVDRVAAAGVEVLVVDQSRPDIELRVAKVMAPGLRHFWRRLGPGRLFDLPVAMGHLDKPRAYDELNPRSVFF